MRQEWLVERPRAVLEMTIDAFPVDFLPFRTYVDVQRLPDVERDVIKAA